MRKIELTDGALLSADDLQRESAFDADAMRVAVDIVADVRERGDACLRELAAKFDGVELSALEVTEEEIADALDLVDDEFLYAIDLAIDNVEQFHRRQVQQSWFTTRDDGAILGQKVTPLERVGIYVPGGRAQYPSTVVMNAVPARVAGVREVVMCTPAGKDGRVNPYTLAAAALAGVDRIFKTGGAQAIAAMAYGTASIPAVEKVTGPGNAFVAAAKKIVSGDVGIDMIAGPSEVCIVADETAMPTLIAIDLMAQAEHDPKATCYLVTTVADLVPEVEAALAELMEETTRPEITAAALEHSLVVTCETLTQAFDAVNKIAPEHLEVCMRDPWELLSNVRNAGAVFLGMWTPESVGDYVAGPSHTLPTGGTAVFSNPLNVEDFVKKSSIISYTPDALMNDADAIEILAEKEGLWSHGAAVMLRRLVLEYAEGLDEHEHGEDCECGCHDHGDDGTVVPFRK